MPEFDKLILVLFKLNVITFFVLPLFLVRYDKKGVWLSILMTVLFTGLVGLAMALLYRKYNHPVAAALVVFLPSVIYTYLIFFIYKLINKK